MTKNIIIKASKRVAKKESNKELREKGLLPAVVYGNIENQSISINRIEFEKTYLGGGESSLIDLVIDGGETIKVVVKEISKDPIREGIVHADFYAVDMSKKIIAETNLVFVGESRAVKEMAGTLLKNRESLEISCLPGDLLSHIDVDISVLETFEDAIKIKDLKLPEGVESVLDVNELVVSVARPTKEEDKKPEEDKKEEEVDKKEVEGEKSDDKKEEKK